MTTRPVRSVDVSGVTVPAPSRPAPGGPLWVEARPGLRRLHVLAGDVLAAMGKRRDLAGKGRNQQEDVTLAVAWLRAHGVQDLVVTEAQRLHPIILNGLVRLADDAGAALWLLHRPPRDEAFLRALARKHAAPTESADVPRPVTGLTAQQPEARPALPAVPADEFVTFRSAYRMVLAPAEAKAVDARFDSSLLRCTDAFAARGATRETVADELYRILNPAPADAELTVDVRALQVASWHHDVYVKVDLPRLLHSEERPRILAGELDAALVAYRQPYRALTVALTRAGHGVADITTVLMSDVDAVAGMVTVGGTPVALAPHTARALRAQLHVRHGEGAGPDEPLLPHSPKALAKALTDAATNLGIHVFGRRAERTRNHTESALRALGITLASLP